MHAQIDRLLAQAHRYDVGHEGSTVCWRRWGSDSAPGSNPSVVLLHGGHGSWMHWIRNIEALSARRTVWVPDLPGFGDSNDVIGDPREPGRERRVVQALKATLLHLLPTDTRLDLVGFSFGAYVAAELAAAFREAVRSLALLGAAGHGGARRIRSELRQWRLEDRALMLDALRHNLAALMLHDPAAIDELALEVHEASCGHTRFHSKSISRAGGLPNALNGFDGPTLLLWGQHDVTAVPELIGPLLVDGQPHREWRTIPGAGHWVAYERADEVNQQLNQWLDRVMQSHRN